MNHPLPLSVSGPWLEAPATQQIFALLEQAGHQIYAVGGCVRNAILGTAVSDIDLSTSARPDRVLALARAAGVKAVPTGIEHGTLTLVIGGTGYEITTWRRDVETDGRRAVVAFSERIEEDAMRRDFTMNALYADARGQIIDPLGCGIADARARHIRFVGEPSERIREDYLRILRFFRFYAHYGDPAEGPDPEGLAACAELAGGIELLARERIGSEMKKLLAAPDPAPALAAMQASGVLAHALPGADAKAMALLVHFEAGRRPDALRRLAVLGGADPATGLRLSRQEAREYALIRDHIGSQLSPAALAVKIGASAGASVLLARAALFETPPPGEAEAGLVRGAQAQFPVRSTDLPGLSGPALGARLKALEQAWLSSDLRLSRAELLALSVPGPGG
ncbi:CCA tRNA nucleotidyltransferase [Pseudogemmobacter faecipullorum]|uniref:CCA tRNA nucleotidyltransferase n=1 Tax=Pseudogemmobacter faecipullorum TaxID=2755041 RepID=A0ABS8CHQ1_9RHOB|nr:CCA tRNA nucleotidyltransferase [Pseudogemmobacter faecipullorum]MCB5408896.1 CCA tRNA nucleotidyltransferase [Pseudogemmobacter faecipullorum]